MIILGILIQLLSGATLLLYGVRLLRMGLQGQFGALIRRQLGDTQPKTVLLAKGATLGFAMQGGTAVLLMAAGLAQSRVISTAVAMLIALGAEFGSALAVKALSVSPGALGPLLILIGGSLTLYGQGSQKKRNFGHLFLGLGLIFLALSLLRQAAGPIAGSAFLDGALSVIGGDPVNAVLLGFVLTLVMHSSLVALLTGAAMLVQVDVSAIGLLAFMLGCNLGSAALPVWLLRQDDGTSKSVAYGVGLMRAVLALVVLGLLYVWPHQLATALSQSSQPDILIHGHIAFNAALLLLGGFCHHAARLVSGPDEPVAAMQVTPQQLADTPHLALADIKRHIHVMLETLGEMVEAATAPIVNAPSVRDAETRLNAEFTALRTKFADLPVMPDDIEDDIRLLLDFSTRVERSGDIVSGKYLSIRDEEREGVFVLNPSANRELMRQLGEVKAVVAMSQHVFWKQDPFEARTLILQKQAIADLELEHRQNHFSRLREDTKSELASSDQYLEMIAILKEVASKVATIGYIVLDQHGGLKRSRLTSLKKLQQTAGEPQ